MKKVLPLTLVLLGAALLVTAVVFWIDSNNSAAPQNFGQSLRDWITLIVGLGASIKGWVDLVKKEKTSPPTQSNQDGGVIISGKVDSVGKDLIGRDQYITTNIVSEDTAYNVEGLPNPYLGLHAFTYNERDRYAGREKLTEDALQLLVSPGEQKNLLFVTGASGSGKSSFAQASLLPALINYYRRNAQNVKFDVFRPSRNPKTRLTEATKRLGFEDVQVIIIDQFEELFTQSEPNERDGLFEFMRDLPPFEERPLHVIATLRSDYLGEMFDVQSLWEIAKQGVELREMRIQELKNAIVRPMQSKYPDGDKRIEARLVEKLATDTVESITYLPLLQVTLEELWNKGQLKLSAYNSLTDAIKERADTVLTYHDFDKASPNNKRTKIEQENILGILLDLVNPSLDADLRHDVRISRKLTEFDEKNINLLRELSRARLVSIEVEDGVEIVNLIHEALIRSWDVLRNGIQEKRVQLQKRVRFEEQLRIWVSQDMVDDFLLSKGQLAEALELNQYNDIATRTSIAQEFLLKSSQKIRETENVIANMENRARRNRAGLEITETISRQLDSSMALQALGRETLTQFDMSLTMIAEMAKDGPRLLHILGSVPALANPENLFGQRNPLRTCLDSGETILISNLDENLEWRENPMLTTLGAKSLICLPINIERTTVAGMMALGHGSLPPFTSDDLQLFQQIARQTSLLLQNISLLNETRRRLQEVNLLLDFSRLLRGLNADQLVHTLLENARRVLPAAHAGVVMMWDEETSQLTPQAVSGYVDNEAMRRIPYRLGESLPSKVFEQKRVLRVDEVLFNRDYNLSTEELLLYRRATGGRLPISSLLIPIQSDKKDFGVLLLDNFNTPAAFHDDDETLLVSLSQQVALSLQNVYLVQATQERVAQLERYITGESQNSKSQTT